jgi:excisionase family DNA binding protein
MLITRANEVDMPDDDLLTVAQVAALLHAHPETIRRWLSAGRLQGIRLGGDRLGWRIRSSEIERFISVNEVKQ